MISSVGGLSPLLTDQIYKWGLIPYRCAYLESLHGDPCKEVPEYIMKEINTYNSNLIISVKNSGARLFL